MKKRPVIERLESSDEYCSLKCNYKRIKSITVMFLIYKIINKTLYPLLGEHELHFILPPCR